MQAWPHPDIPKLPGAVPTPVRVHDSSTKELVAVGPESGTARLYVCGITPYDATHMGHANTYVTFDLLYRQWLDAGIEVNYVQNITDIDDPLLERANATGVDWRELADSQIELFRGDMTALGVIPPAHYIGAVEGIPLVLKALDRIPQDMLYQVEGEYRDWYFTAPRVSDFGEVAGLDHDTQIETFAERGGDPERPGKRDPLDTLVWQLERPGEPSWPGGDRGRGRPGWHIECTAIANEYLGASIDVQGGGSDLAFPHHEMSAAQSHALTGEPFAKAYVHGGMVGLDGEKMSKSKGNLVKVSELRAEGVDPRAVRLGLLAHHYRGDWSWSAEVLAAAEQRLGTWRRAVAAESGPAGTDALGAMRQALRTDLDAPTALAVVDAWAASTLAGEGSDASAPGLVADAVQALLGVDLRA